MGNIYVGDSNSIARKIKNGYIGIDGIARKIKQIYVGDANGKARLAWQSSLPILILTNKNALISYDGGNSFQTMTTNLTSDSVYVSYDYDNKRYIRMYKNAPYYSYDGYNWTSIGSSPVMVAGGSAGVINCDGGVYVTPVDRISPYYSSDMNNWHKTGYSTTAISDDSYCSDIIYDSTSGKIAETYYYNATGVYGIAIGNLTGGIISYDTGEKYSNVIVINGNFVYSVNKILYFRLTTNPTSWNIKYTPSQFKRLCYHNGTLLAADDYSFYKSTDLGATWTTITVLPATSQMNLCYGQGYFWYICTHYDVYTSKSYYCLYKSLDGTKWSQVLRLDDVSSCSLCVGEKNNGIY